MQNWGPQTRPERGYQNIRMKDAADALKSDQDEDKTNEKEDIGECLKPDSNAVFTKHDLQVLI